MDPESQQPEPPQPEPRPSPAEAFAEDAPRADAPAANESIARPLIAPTRPPEQPPERPARPDPWAHRRGEPRVFALLWTIFLFAATATTMLLTVARGFPAPETMRPAARAMLITVAAGIAVIWPLFRLSQRRDDRPVIGMVHDVVVIMVPVQAIVWPQTLWWLGHWPVGVVAAVGASLTAWSLMVGGLLALAYATESAPYDDAFDPRRLLRRTVWMSVIVAATVGPAALALIPGDADVRWWWMFSPVTSAAEIVRDRAWSGLTASVHPLHWWIIVGTALLALPVWFAAGSAQERQRRRPVTGPRYSAGLD